MCLMSSSILRRPKPEASGTRILIGNTRKKSQFLKNLGIHLSRGKKVHSNLQQKGSKNYQGT